MWLTCSVSLSVSKFLLCLLGWVLIQDEQNWPLFTVNIKSTRKYTETTNIWGFNTFQTILYPPEVNSRSVSQSQMNIGVTGGAFIYVTTKARDSKFIRGAAEALGFLKLPGWGSLEEWMLTGLGREVQDETGASCGKQ